MMIYDCFAFFNELELLEIRLNELNDVVDKFVLVEATRTFQKQPKPLYFQENKHLFKDFEHKIIHIVVDKYPTFWKKFRVPTPWDYDDHQKEHILLGLQNCKDDDVIIVSDLDEIPRAEKVKEYAYTEGIKVFRQYFACYFLNNICKKINDYEGKAKAQINENGFGWWQGSVMLSYKDLKSKTKTIEKTRLQRDLAEPQVKIIHQGGWHFSYMGGMERIIKKLESLAHPEFNNDFYKNEQKVKELILSGKSLFSENEFFERVDIFNTEIPFPKYVKENLNKFKHLIF
jgi:beta-1,4-mannosyl-glycoprotein beta-1,4-N-acetylglucosaminyltransferase